MTYHRRMLPASDRTEYPARHPINGSENNVSMTKLLFFYYQEAKNWHRLNLRY